MKRYLLLLLVPVFVMFLIVSPVLGIAYPDGQQHYYSVLFRGNGEAIVSFKGHFSNLSNQTVQTISLHVPNGTVSDVSAYQVRTTSYYPPPCYPYDLQQPQVTPIYPDPVSEPFLEENFSPPSTGSTRPGATPAPDQLQDQKLSIMPCYRSPDYDPYYTYGGTRYEKAQVSVNGQTLVVNLPYGVAPNQDGNYFLTYRTTGVARRTMLGAYAFNFETLKLDAPVSAVQIGVATDENYILKDTKGNINYNGTVSVSKALPSIVSDSSVTNAALETYYNQIGQGTLYKTATHLSPMESYSLSGMYADSSWKLYGREFGIGLAILVLVGALVFFGIRFLLRKMRSKTPVIESKHVSFVYQSMHQYMLLSALVVSFVSALSMVLFTVVLYLLGNNFGVYIPYSNMQVILFVLVVLSSVGVYSLFLFGPAILVGVKRSLGWGVGVFGLTVLWVGLFTLVLFLVLALFGRSSMIEPYPYPVYPMDAPASVSGSTPADR